MLRIHQIVIIAALLCAAGCSNVQTNGSGQTYMPTTRPLSMAIDVAPVAREQTIGQIEPVALFYSQMPTGVTISHDGRMFVCFPRWGDDVEFTVGEVRNDQVLPYPNLQINQNWQTDPAAHLVSVQSVIIDPDNRLWLLDTGSTNFGPTVPNGPKLVCVDLATNRLVRTILIPPNVALKTTYLNDVRFDLRRGKSGMAFITDSSSNGPNAIIVVDLATGRSWRKLNDHPSVKAEKDFRVIVEGMPLMLRQAGSLQPKPLTFGVDGIAISADGKQLYYCALASRELYSVSTDALADPNLPDADVAKTVQDLGPKGFASDGLESDDAGRLYLTDYGNHAIIMRRPSGEYETLAYDPRMLWPDTLCVANNGYLYFTVNQLERMPRFHWGQDFRQKPYAIFRTRITAGPVLLR